MSAPELVVMAAGVGSRYGGLKQVEPVGPGGKVLMDYAVYDAARAGVERAVFVIRREMEADFHERLGRRYARLVDVGYAFQEMDAGLPAGFAAPAERRKPWGTAHAVLVARERVQGPFVVINADDFYGAAGFRAVVELLGGEQEELGGEGEGGAVTARVSNGEVEAQREGVDEEPDQAAAAAGVTEGTAASTRVGSASERYALVAYELEKTLSEHGEVARGVCEVDANGKLRSIAEHTGVRREGDGIRGVAPDGSVLHFTGREPVSMNLWGFRPSLFDHLEERFASFLAERGSDHRAELYLPALVDELIQEGKATVQVLHTPDRWFGVTYREDRDEVAARIRELIARGEYPPNLWS